MSQKTLTAISQKKLYRQQVSMWKDTRYHMSSQKCKFKQPDSTTHLFVSKFRTLTTPNVAKDIQQQTLSYIAGGSTEGYSHVGRQFVSFFTKLNLL